MPRKFLSLPVLLAVLFAVVSASAQTPLLRISGQVVRVEGSNLELRASGGETIAIKLSDKVRTSLRSPGGADAIRQGAYIGATAAPQADGTLLASEVQIFPESMRGTSEGHRPMATEPGGAAGNTMTNATVASVAPRERALKATLTYKGGEKTVVIPEGATIMVTEVGDRSSLVPGANVVAYVAKQPDGTLLSERVSVGKNGYVPPR